MEKLEKIIGYEFKDKRLLELALTHSSYAKNLGTENNERLEFLGDAVLELAVSEFLYKKYGKEDEGYLTRFRSKIVCENSLAKIAKKISIGEYLKLGHGEEINGGRNKSSILSDAVEALLGAIFLDSDFLTSKNIILSLIKNFPEILNQDGMIDPKSRLQELLQESSTELVKYEITHESGPSHDKTYVAQVSHHGKVLGEGSGKSKKEAEQEAALRAINNLG